MSEMPDELVHTAETPIYHRLNDENHTKYEAFVEWCRIPPSSRNLANFTRRTGYPPNVARKMMAEWHWEVRANAFDHDSMQLRPDPRAMDEEIALAGQLAAANTLLDLGLRVLDTKNVAMIPTDKGIKLVEKGIEMQRRAMGQADLNIQFTIDDMTRVNKMIGDVVGEDIEDAEIIDDPDVLPPDDPGEIDVPM